MSGLQRAIRALADEWAANIGQGSGHYLNPRVVVDRLDAALESAAPPTSTHDKLIEAGWITPEMCARKVTAAKAEALCEAELAIRALVTAHCHLPWEPPESCELGPALVAVAALRTAHDVRRLPTRGDAG